MKKIFSLILILIFLLSSCSTKKDDSSIEVEEKSASDNLILYRSMQDELEQSGINASTSDYYETEFSFEISYLSGRTTTNVLKSIRNCKIRNDSLYIKYENDFSYYSLESSNTNVIYTKEDDKYYSYEYEGLIETIDTLEILPCYNVKEENEFELSNIIGFSQAVLTSHSYDGTNGTIEKDNNKYIIKMPYENVKNDSLIKFVFDSGFLSNIFSYINSEDLTIDFIYDINESGYSLKYGFSYEANEKKNDIYVNLKMNKINEFETIDFKDETKYVKKYPENFSDVLKINNLNETVSGRYQGYTFFKFYLEEGYYGITYDNSVYTKYNVYSDSLGIEIPKDYISLSDINITTNYFEITVKGYYYIYIEISKDLPNFKLEKINDINIENYELKENNQNELNNYFDYDVYNFNLENSTKIVIKNETDKDICLVLPILTNFFFYNYVNYRNINLKANSEIEINLTKGNYYIIVSPILAEESLSYNFSVNFHTI